MRGAPDTWHTTYNIQHTTGTGRGRTVGHSANGARSHSPCMHAPAAAIAVAAAPYTLHATAARRLAKESPDGLGSRAEPSSRPAARAGAATAGSVQQPRTIDAARVRAPVPSFLRERRTARMAESGSRGGCRRFGRQMALSETAHACPCEVEHYSCERTIARSVRELGPHRVLADRRVSRRHEVR